MFFVTFHSLWRWMIPPFPYLVFILISCFFWNFSNSLPLVSKSWWSKKKKKGYIVTKCCNLWLYNQFMSWFIHSLESNRLKKLQHTDTVWKSSKDPASWLSLLAGRRGAGHEDPPYVCSVNRLSLQCKREVLSGVPSLQLHLSHDYLI